MVKVAINDIVSKTINNLGTKLSVISLIDVAALETDLLGGAEAEPAEDGAEDKAGEEDGDDDDSAEHGEPVLLETDEGISPEAGSFFDDLYPVLR